MIGRFCLLATALILTGCQMTGSGASSAPSENSNGYSTCSSDFRAAAQKPAGNLHVQVVDEKDQPVPHARLIISRDYTGVTCPNGSMAEADESGRYELDGIIPGTYSVNLQATSPAVYEQVHITDGATISVKLVMPGSTLDEKP